MTRRASLGRLAGAAERRRVQERMRGGVTAVVAAEAGRGSRPLRREEVAERGDVVLSCRQRQVERAAGVALRAVAAIAREAHLVEVVHARPKAVDGEVAGQL